MKVTYKIVFASLSLALFLNAFVQTGVGQENEDYLSWNLDSTERIGKRMRQKGKIGSRYSLRGINTERAVNYKLRATLMTPEMIRASARKEQLTNRLSDADTRILVKEAEDAGDLVVMIELDPNEGSGVIPLDWRVFLQPKGLAPGEEGAIAGVKMPKLKYVKALSGVFRRKYDYDLFMVVFPLVDANGKALLPPDTSEIEIIVGINKKEGHLDWQMPASLSDRIRTLSTENSSEEK